MYRILIVILAVNLVVSAAGAQVDVSHDSMSVGYVAAGENTSLACELTDVELDVGDTLTWAHTPLNSSEVHTWFTNSRGQTGAPANAKAVLTTTPNFSYRLELTDAQPINAGIIYCIYDMNGGISLNTSLELLVTEPVQHMTINGQSDGSALAVVRDLDMLTVCHVHSSVTPSSIELYVGGSPLATGRNVKTLSISHGYRGEDEGQSIKCIAHVPLQPPHQVSVAVDLMYPPYIVCPKKVSASSSSSLRCSIKASPLPSESQVLWMDAHSRVLSNSTPGLLFHFQPGSGQHEAEATLTFVNMDEKHFSTYTLEVENMYGSRNATVRLDKPDPSVRPGPRPVAVEDSLGSSAKLSVCLALLAVLCGASIVL